jgi:hypothetical protein
MARRGPHGRSSHVAARGVPIDLEGPPPLPRLRWRVAAGTLPRKEVIQPQLPLRLPCYDFAPVTLPTLGACLLAVSSATSGVDGSHSVTGGVYKARERIHRTMLTRGY